MPALRVAGSFVFRASCYAVMLWVALWCEGRAAPRLPDVVLESVPYMAWVDELNYLVWLLAYVPIAAALLVIDAERFIRYMVSAGLLALVRAVTMLATGLGPVRGADVHAGHSLATWDHFLELASPWNFFDPNHGARTSLTKDLFFSGHTATTFLLLLYVWRFPRLRAPMLAAHVLVVASVFAAHMHYTIDVLGAWAVTMVVFTLREGRVGV